MRFRNMLVPFISLFVLASLILLAGCPAPERRPAPPPPNTIPSPENNDMGRNPNVTPPPSPENDRQNEEANVQPLVNMVEKIPEVNNAWIILNGHTVFVGVDLKDNIGANRINSLKEEIATKIKQAEHSMNNDIRNVIVTADPNLVTRIERVAVGIANGRPISSFANEITEITQRLTPLNQ